MEGAMKIFNICLVGTAILIAGPASATIYFFSGGGFSEGATITGAFQATDLNMNGQISSFDGEVTNFSATFSGNSVVGGPYDFVFSDLIGLVYNLDGVLGDNTFGDGGFDDAEGIFAGSDQAVFGVGDGPFNNCDGVTPCAQIFNTDFVQDFSVEAFSVAVVPEPATWGLMIAGFGAVGFAMRRRRLFAAA